MTFQLDVNMGTESGPVQDGGSQSELTNETDSLFRKFLMFQSHIRLELGIYQLGIPVMTMTHQRQQCQVLVDTDGRQH
jgi:hypothetical protein